MVVPLARLLNSRVSEYFIAGVFRCARGSGYGTALSAEAAEATVLPSELPQGDTETQAAATLIPKACF
jgi:hypothetical protein